MSFLLFSLPTDPCPSVSGIGAGTKDFDKHPNILRVILGEVPAPPPAQEPQPIQPVASVPSDGAGETGDWIARQLWVLEANIDDMTGEAAGYLTEKLLEVPNCLDAWLSPILMKKGRPAFTVHVLCEPQDQEQFMRVLFTESTTLGVRRRSVERCALRRKIVLASTTFGDVRVKVGVNSADDTRVFRTMYLTLYVFSLGYVPAGTNLEVLRLAGLF